MPDDELSRMARAMAQRQDMGGLLLWQLAQAIYLQLQEHALIEGPEDALQDYYPSDSLSREAWRRADEFAARGRADRTRG